MDCRAGFRQLSGICIWPKRYFYSCLFAALARTVLLSFFFFPFTEPNPLQSIELPQLSTPLEQSSPEVSAFVHNPKTTAREPEAPIMSHVSVIHELSGSDQAPTAQPSRTRARIRRRRSRSRRHASDRDESVVDDRPHRRGRVDGEGARFEAHQHHVGTRSREGALRLSEHRPSGQLRRRRTHSERVTRRGRNRRSPRVKRERLLREVEARDEDIERSMATPSVRGGGSFDPFSMSSSDNSRRKRVRSRSRRERQTLRSRARNSHIYSVGKLDDAQSQSKSRRSQSMRAQYQSELRSEQTSLFRTRNN
jgi:hypothetical protein